MEGQVHWLPVYVMVMSGIGLILLERFLARR
jgi:hypothetical protein